MLKVFAAAVAAVVLGACSTSNVGLTYRPTATVIAAAAASPAVATADFTDNRGEPARWLGAIRGGFGNPLKTLESDRPVAELVGAAFADGLKARGFKGGADAPLRISGSIKRLDCNQVMRREATAEVDLVVTQVASGRKVFARSYKAYNADGATVAAGVFGSIEDLRAITERTLRELVDKALDDAELRAALRP